jgi:hypothetical protein
MSTQNSSTLGNVGNAIFERNLLIGTNNTNEFLSLHFGGTTIRNNTAMMPDVITTINSFRSFVKYQDQPTTIENTREPVVIAGNTIIQLQSRSPQTFFLLDGFASWTNSNVRAANNLIYAPNVPNSAEFPNYLPLNRSDIYRPQVGSSAIGSAAPDGFVFDTLDGKLRPVRPSVGSLEP